MAAWSRPRSLGLALCLCLSPALIAGCRGDAADSLAPPGAGEGALVEDSAPPAEPGAIDVAAPTGGPAAEAATAPDCSCLPEGGLGAQLVTEALYESEEIAFNGKGLLVAKKGEQLVGIPAFGPSRVISRDPALATLSLGLRFLPDGDLVVAQPAVEEGLTAKLLRISPGGAVSEFFNAAAMPEGLPPFIIPNGLHADSAGNVFVSDFATSHIFRVAPDGTVASLVVGPDAAGVAGLAFDGARSTLFYSSRPPGTLRRLRVAPSGAPVGPPELVTTVEGARLDSVVLDACGNLYAVDSDPSKNRFRLLRVKLDAEGAAASAPTVMATFDDWVSGAQFGSGPGYDKMSLYVSSIWGKVYRVRVGVSGAKP